MQKIIRVIGTILFFFVTTFRSYKHNIAVIIDTSIDVTSSSVITTKASAEIYRGGGATFKFQYEVYKNTYILFMFICSSFDLQLMYNSLSNYLLTLNIYLKTSTTKYYYRWNILFPGTWRWYKRMALSFLLDATGIEYQSGRNPMNWALILESFTKNFLNKSYICILKSWNKY